MKTKNYSFPKHLGIIVALFLGLTLFTGFDHKPSIEIGRGLTHKLTIKPASGYAVESFDLIILGKTTSGDIYTKREKAMKTPFELSLEPGQYSIVINRISSAGKIVGRIEQQVDGKPSDSAQADDKITVLVVDKDGFYSASGL